VNPRYRKRQQYKEPHNYAKLLLQSEKALENLSRKIRTEIQHSEMLELALEAERAANAGVLSFSAKPSTFGLDSLPSRDSQNHPVPRPRTYSEGNKPFITPHIPAYKELKRFELRNVSEVFPPWKALHSHMRTHLFRRRVPVDYLTFCEGEFKKAPTSSVNPLDLSARDLAQNSLQFLENLADTTMSRIKKYPIIAQRASCQASCSDEPSEEKFHDSQSSTSKSTAFGPELSSRLPQKSTIRGHPLDVVPGVFRPDSIESEPPTIDGEPPKHAPTMLGGNKQYRYHRENVQDPGVDAVVLPTKNLKENSIHDRVSDEKTRLLTDSASGPFSEKVGSLKSTETITRTPRRDHASSNRNSGFETPSGLRDIRERRDLRSSRRDVLTPVLSSAHYEPSSIVESCSVDGEEANDGKPTMATRTLEMDHTLFLALPTISGRPKESADGRELDYDDLARRKLLQTRLEVFPVVKTNAGDKQSVFLGNFQSRESRLGEEKKETDVLCSSDERLYEGSGNYSTAESVVEKSIGNEVEGIRVEMPRNNMRDPISCDLECCDEESSESTTLRNIHNEVSSLVSTTSVGGVAPQEKSLTRRRRLGCEASQQTHRGTPKLFQNHAICHSFTSPDENFQVAVEAMMAGFSPTSPSWRRTPYFGEQENDEFLTNFFYCTRHGGDVQMKARNIRGRMCIDDDIGVDAVCSDLYQIFSSRPGGSASGKSQPRIRAVSLDARVPSESFKSWLGAVENLFSRCGSSSETVVGKSTPDQAQFEPPHLKKTSNWEDSRG
jgi:hypothetical protein